MRPPMIYAEMRPKEWTDINYFQEWSTEGILGITYGISLAIKGTNYNAIRREKLLFKSDIFHIGPHTRGDNHQGLIPTNAIANTISNNFIDMWKLSLVGRMDNKADFKLLIDYVEDFRKANNNSIHSALLMLEDWTGWLELCE